MFDGSMHEWMGGWWPMGGLFWIAIIGLVAYGVFAFSQQSSRREPGMNDGGSPALRMLDERYAKGEIDREEYLRRKRDILGKGET